MEAFKLSLKSPSLPQPPSPPLLPPPSLPKLPHLLLRRARKRSLQVPEPQRVVDRRRDNLRPAHEPEQDVWGEREFVWVWVFVCRGLREKWEQARKRVEA